MPKLVLVGASGHAAVIIDIIEKMTHYELLGLVDDNIVLSRTLLDYPILGKIDELPTLYQQLGDFSIIIAVGDNCVRAQLVEKIAVLLPQVNYATAIHPSAQCAKATTINAGSVLMANVVVNSSATIGQHCILNTASTLDHDGVMADYSSLAPQVAVGGNVQVGRCSALGIGCCVKHGICIGENTVIGAGSVLLESVRDNLVYYGVPAKRIRTRQFGEKYL